MKEDFEIADPFDIELTAMRYVELFGNRAGLEAALRADSLYANGKVVLFDLWMAVIDAIDDLQQQSKATVH